MTLSTLLAVLIAVWVGLLVWLWRLAVAVKRLEDATSRLDTLGPLSGTRHG